MSSENQNDVTELYEEYKRMVTLDRDGMNDFKKRVATIIAKKQLTSFMNDAKWLQLQLAVDELLFPPSYVVRCITDEEEAEKEALAFLNTIPRYLGNWSNFYNEGMPILFNIEWVKVYPQLGVFRGMLIEDEVIDESESFRKILNRLSIPHNEESNIFTIYGYKA